jgi:hypothetical protein
MRVRIGLHSGTVTTIGVHEKTKRATFGGSVMQIAEAVSNAPCGGQIVVSGDTMASIVSMQDLMAEVSKLCADWVSCAPNSSRTAGGVWDEPAALSVASLGFHILDGVQQTMPDATSHETTVEITSPSSTNLQINQWLATFDQAPNNGHGEPLSEPGRRCSDSANRSSRRVSDCAATNQRREDFLLSHARELIEVVAWPLRERVR